jgi:uncharacterized surface protein with fasciclin (FAS1) repeats
VTVPPSPGSTTWDIIQASRDLSRLEELVEFAGLESELDSVTELRTILAPSNDAFALFEGAPGNDAIIADSGQVADLLRGHIAPGSLTTSNIFSLDELRMLNADIVPINDDQTIGTDNAVVQVPDVESANGYLHVIDAVLPIQDS